MKLSQKINELLWKDSLGNTVYFSYNVSQTTFMIIKGILLLYMCFCFVLNQITWSHSRNWFKQFIFLTLWGFYLTLTYIVMSFAYNYSVLIKMKKDKDYTPSFTFLPKFINILFEIVFSLELTITIIFWAIVFPSSTDVSIGQILNTFNFHGGMLIVLWIDNIFNAIQFRRNHMIPLFIVSFLYCSLNCIYVLAAQELIYPGLNWVSLMSYIELIGSAALSVVHFIIGLFYYKYRKNKLLNENQLGANIALSEEASHVDNKEGNGNAYLQKSLVSSKVVQEVKSMNSENYA